MAGRLGFANFVALDGHRLGLSLNIDADAAFFREPQNAVLLDPVVISLKRRLRLFAEKDAGLAARADVVIANDVVRIAMPDGNAVATVPFDEVLFRQTPADAPAPEESLVVIG